MLLLKHLLSQIALYRILGLNIHGSYIANTVARLINLITLALLSLFFIFELLSNSTYIGQGDFTFYVAAVTSALKLPVQLYDVMPISVVAGAIVGLATLANHSEITVFRTSQLSPKRLFTILMITGIPYVIMTLIIGEWIQPITSRYADSLRTKTFNTNGKTQLKTGIWLKNTLFLEHLQFINIPNIDSDGNALTMIVYEFDNNMHLLTRIQAHQGQLIQNTIKKSKAWKFKNIITQHYNPNTGQQLNQVRSHDWIWTPPLSLNALIGLQNNPEQVGIVSLLETTLFQKNNHLDYKKSLSILLRRLLHPIALWVMLAMALPFAYLRPRDGGMAGRIFVGVLLGMSFHSANRLFEFLSLVQGWPIAITAPLPLLIGILTAILLFLRFHRLR